MPLINKTLARVGGVVFGESGRGIGLRSPRFERFRPDRKPEEVTSSDHILEVYYAQDSIAGSGDNSGGWIWSRQDYEHDSCVFLGGDYIGVKNS